jgi:phosphoglycolate phosphatase-like HAD superfamily hydrolase
MRLLITDLDNTLYDWVTFFALSFRAMVKSLAEITAISEEALLDDFKAVHQKHGNSEYPFAILELPLLRAKYSGYSDQEVLVAVDGALHEFNRVRAQTLRLYDGVAETLERLRNDGVIIVGHTEAITVNAYYRLKKLQIDHVFSKLYSLDGFVRPHPKGEADRLPPAGLVEGVPLSERKPNPRLLLDICKRLDVSPKEAVYVGDSLTRDVSMATEAGVLAVWAKYGTLYDRSLWSVLVRITHWSDEDVRREEELRHRFGNVHPDLTINAFSDVLPLFSADGAASA